MMLHVVGENTKVQAEMMHTRFGVCGVWVRNRWTMSEAGEMGGAPNKRSMQAANAAEHAEWSVAPPCTRSRKERYAGTQKKQMRMRKQVRDWV